MEWEACSSWKDAMEIEGRGEAAMEREWQYTRRCRDGVRGSTLALSRCQRSETRLTGKVKPETKLTVKWDNHIEILRIMRAAKPDMNGQNCILRVLFGW
jgi:hypothetical protein